MQDVVYQEVIGSDDDITDYCATGKGLNSIVWGS